MVTTSPTLEERKLALEERRLQLEERRWEVEGLDKAGAGRSPWKSPLLIAILTAAAAAAGNAVVSLVNASAGVRLEKLKGEQALITEMIKTGGDGEKTAANLRFLVEAGLLTDDKRRASLSAYLDKTKTSPDLLPSLPSSGALPASTAERAATLSVSDACKSRGATGAYCVENGILISPAGTPFEVVDGTRRTDPLATPPQAIVLHFSAAPDGAAKALFKSPTAPGSVHVEINRDGSIVQLVPFDIAANHAGASRWNGITGLNTKSIGLSFANWGRLTGGPGTWRSYSGKPVADRDVFVQLDAAGGPVAGWERYTPAQLAGAEKIIEALIRSYPSIKGIVGHSEISVPPGRKSDPGPALPSDRFRALLRKR